MPEKLRKVVFEYFLEAVKPPAMSVYKENRGSKKGHLKIKFTMVKRNPRTDEIEDRAEFHWLSRYLPFFHATDLGEFYDEHKNNLINKYDELKLRGSGWELESIDNFWVYTTKYTPLRVGPWGGT